jgi:hypothetical protein
MRGLLIAKIRAAFQGRAGMVWSESSTNLGPRPHADGRVGGGRGDDPQREMDLRPLVIDHRGDCLGQLRALLSAPRDVGNTRSEYMFSGVPPEADILHAGCDFRVVP